MSAPNIGDLLRAWGHITPDQLRRAVQLQRDRPTERLGQILVSMQAASPRAVKDALGKQQAIRAGRRLSVEDTIAIAKYATQVLEDRVAKA